MGEKQPKTGEKGCRTEMYGILFSIFIQKIFIFNKNPKSLGIYGEISTPKVPVWVKIAGENSVSFIKFTIWQQTGRKGRKCMLNMHKNKEKIRRNLCNFYGFLV